MIVQIVKKWQPFFEILQLWIFDVIDKLQITVAIVALNLMVMKYPQFFKIQDGGNHHLEFFQLCIFDIIDMFQIEVSDFGDDRSNS